jgi:hypothetical protein
MGDNLHARPSDDCTGRVEDDAKPLDHFFFRFYLLKP